jgi:hypothetical protein
MISGTTYSEKVNLQQQHVQLLHVPQQVIILVEMVVDSEVVIESDQTLVEEVEVVALAGIEIHVEEVEGPMGTEEVVGVADMEDVMKFQILVLQESLDRQVLVDMVVIQLLNSHPFLVLDLLPKK